MDVEKEARVAAIQHVANLFQRPDQLERLSEIKKRTERKKAAVEAMLRTGVQSQLEGIRTALAHLSHAAEDVVAIEHETATMRSRLSRYPELQREMSALREAAIRHGQYAAAIENVRLIMTMQQMITDTKEALAAGKLLLAHKHIMDLERARDELLLELHRQKSDTTEKDKKSLLTLFRDVDSLVDKLWQSMRHILMRSLEMCTGTESEEGAPAVVSTLRIIEREERIDRHYVTCRTSLAGFVPPGRPRRWKDKAMDVLRESIDHAVQGTQMYSSVDKPVGWVAVYMKSFSRFVRERLGMAKQACRNCFPPHYSMYDNFVAMYHQAISHRLREIAGDPDLKRDDIAQLLVWVKSYTGEEMLGDPRLEWDVNAMVADDPLLPSYLLIELHDRFLDLTREYVKNTVLVNTLEKQKKDWAEDVVPEMDGEGYFYTYIPQTLFSFMYDMLNISKEFPLNLQPAVIDISIQEFRPFALRYKDAALELKNSVLKNRDTHRHFTAIMVSVANNMWSCMENTEKCGDRIRLSMEENEGGAPLSCRTAVRRGDILHHINELASLWNSAAFTIANALIEEVLLDISGFFPQIFSRDWLDGRCDPASSIVATLEHYVRDDHCHLRPDVRVYLAKQLQIRAVGEYLKAVESRRLTFASTSERRKAVACLERDARNLEKFFEDSLPGEVGEAEFSFLQSILLAMGDLLNLEANSDLLSFEVTQFARKFPNIPNEVLTSLLLLREDVGRAKAKELADFSLAHTSLHPTSAAFKELFDQSRASDSGLFAAPVVMDMHSKFTSLMRRGLNEES